MWKQVKKAKDSHSEDEAYAYAVRLLEFRFRGEAELRDRLVEKGFTDTVCAAAIERLRKLGYVHDERLLESLVREYREFGLYGPLYIKQKLLQKKFSASEATTALRVHYTAREELETARKFTAKHQLVRLAAESPQGKARAMQRLARRGFSASVVYRALEARGDDE